MDPYEAEDWLHSTQAILEAMELSDKEKIQCAIFMLKKEESAECWRCFAWNSDIVETCGLPATMAECYEGALCAEFRLNEIKAEKLRGVKTDQEGRTWLARLLSSHQVLRRIKVVDRRWDCQGQEVKGHILRKETTSLKCTTGSVGTIMHEFTEEQRLFCFDCKGNGHFAWNSPNKEVDEEKREVSKS